MIDDFIGIFRYSIVLDSFDSFMYIVFHVPVSRF